MNKRPSRSRFRVSFAEISVGLSSDGLVLALPSDLKSRRLTNIKAKYLSDYCHIYMVLRRPGLMFVPGRIFCSQAAVYGQLNMMRGGQGQTVDFSVPGQGSPLDWGVSEFPHRMAMSEPIFPSYRLSLPAYAVPGTGHVTHASAHEAEVLYIGQSFGEGHRTALDRLEGHSTLQRVLADAIYHAPDQDILLLLIEYAPPKMVMLIPPQSTYPKEYQVNDAEAEKEIDQRLDQLARSKHNPIIPRRNQVSIVEAALINYFQPPYNKMFVQQKPRQSHRHLLECYNEDFSALAVEVNTEDAKIALYSNARPPGIHHFANFDLHDPETRKSFFRLSAFDSEVGMVKSGPLDPLRTLGKSLRNGRFAVLGW